uniref:receptor protein serine/threonine kinase n=1 Tax=Hofstenia miamia TaxID=442651 RepID=A0A068CNG1_HOFMI|nr:bone morphogenetic protein receptor 2 [Hofstenia miamia]
MFYLFFLIFSQLFIRSFGLKCYANFDQTVDTTKELLLGSYVDSVNVSGNGSEFIYDCLPPRVCFAHWRSQPNETVKKFNLRGCWDHAGFKGECNSKCIARIGSTKQGNVNHRFCCCTTPLCNNNVTVLKPPPISIPPLPKPPIQKSYDMINYLVIGSVIAVIMLVFGFLMLLWYVTCSRPINKPVTVDQINLISPALPPSKPSTVDLDHLHLLQLIGHGRYGMVWRAELGNKEVAVKVFQSQHKLYFDNEKEIFQSDLLSHENIIQFIGDCESHSETDSCLEYLLVLAYIPSGSLMNFLKESTCNFFEMCRLVQSTARGLAYLHSEVLAQNGLHKFPIVHRDVNSRNILVKNDGSCAISDLGFAKRVCGSRFISENEDEEEEVSSFITDVGTLRYMPPEVLDGAVNIRDCESALKQVDTYALALVIWEITSRCNDLYRLSGRLDAVAPAYMLPFEAELGLHPTFDNVKTLVSTNNQRPQFPVQWRSNIFEMKYLIEIMEDSWDSDAEARLSAACIDNRIGELRRFWQQRQSSNQLQLQINPADDDEIGPHLYINNINNQSFTSHTPLLKADNEIAAMERDLSHIEDVPWETRAVSSRMAYNLQLDTLASPAPPSPLNTCISEEEEHSKQMLTSISIFPVSANSNAHPQVNANVKTVRSDVCSDVTTAVSGSRITAQENVNFLARFEGSHHPLPRPRDLTHNILHGRNEASSTEHGEDSSETRQHNASERRTPSNELPSNINVSSI